MKNKGNNKKNKDNNIEKLLRTLSYYVYLCSNNSRRDVLINKVKTNDLELFIRAKLNDNELIRYLYYYTDRAPTLEMMEEIKMLAQNARQTLFSFCLSPISSLVTSLLRVMQQGRKEKFGDIEQEIQNFLDDQNLLEVMIDRINVSFPENYAIFVESVIINNLSYYNLDPRIILFTQSALPFVSPDNIRRLISAFDSNANNLQQIAEYNEGAKKNFISIIENIINNNIAYFNNKQFAISDIFSIIYYAIILEKIDIINLFLYAYAGYQDQKTHNAEIFNLAFSAFIRGNSSISKLFLENIIWDKFSLEQKKNIINLLIDRSDGESLNTMIQELVSRHLLDIDLYHEVINGSQDQSRTRDIMLPFADDIIRNSLSTWEFQAQFWQHIEQMKSISEKLRDNYIQDNLITLQGMGLDQFISTLQKSESLIICDFISRYSFAIMMQETKQSSSKKKKNKPKEKTKKKVSKVSEELLEAKLPEIKKEEDTKAADVSQISENNAESDDDQGNWIVVEKNKATKPIKSKPKAKLDVENSAPQLIVTQNNIIQESSRVIINAPEMRNNTINSKTELEKLIASNNELQNKVESLSKLCDDLKKTILSINRGNLYIPSGYNLVDYHQEQSLVYGQYSVIKIENIFTNEVSQFFYKEDGTLFVPDSQQDNKKQESNKADGNEASASAESESNSEKIESSGNKVEEFYINIVTDKQILENIENEERKAYQDSIVEAEKQAQSSYIDPVSFIETNQNLTEKSFLVKEVIIYEKSVSFPFLIDSDYSWEVELPFLQGDGFYLLY
jgi:hypothetical protein